MKGNKMGKSDLIDIALIVKHETDKAWLVNDGDNDVWLPKSQAESNEDGTFTMPEWLALEKRFI